MWLRTGNVNVTNGSAVVNGGSQSPMFVTNNVLPGYAFNGPDGRRYEVLSVQSETQLTLQRNYVGATAGNQSYEIEQNTGAAEADTKQRINELLTIFRTTAELTSLKVGSPTEASAVAAFLGALVSLENSASARLRLSKGTTGNDVYLEFAVGNSGRARIGLIGNNDIVVQTSPNGSSWTTRMTITSAGAVSLQGVLPIDSGGTGAASAAAARAALDVPGLSVSNTFSAAQVMAVVQALAARLESTLTTAAAGPMLELYRAKANAGDILNGDLCGQILMTARNGDGTKINGAGIFHRLIAKAAAAEQSSLDFMTGDAGGGITTKWRIGGGAPSPSPGGFWQHGLSDPGLGRIYARSYKFPATQNPSADANELDDYEEGLFTPVVRINADATGITLANHFSTYVKIGQIVSFWTSIVLSSKGSNTGVVDITGLPFTVGNYSGLATLAQFSNLVDMTRGLYGRLPSADTRILLSSCSPGGTGTVQLTDANLANNSQFFISGLYRSAT